MQVGAEGNDTGDGSDVGRTVAVDDDPGTDRRDREHFFELLGVRKLSAGTSDGCTPRQERATSNTVCRDVLPALTKTNLATEVSVIVRMPFRATPAVCTEISRPCLQALPTDRHPDARHARSFGEPDRAA